MNINDSTSGTFNGCIHDANSEKKTCMTMFKVFVEYFNRTNETSSGYMRDVNTKDMWFCKCLAHHVKTHPVNKFVCADCIMHLLTIVGLVNLYYYKFKIVFLLNHLFMSDLLISSLLTFALIALMSPLNLKHLSENVLPL